MPLSAGASLTAPYSLSPLSGGPTVVTPQTPSPLSGGSPIVVPEVRLGHRAKQMGLGVSVCLAAAAQASGDVLSATVKPSLGVAFGEGVEVVCCFLSAGASQALSVTVGGVAIVSETVLAAEVGRVMAQLWRVEEGTLVSYLALWEGSGGRVAGSSLAAIDWSTDVGIEASLVGSTIHSIAAHRISPPKG